MADFKQRMSRHLRSAQQWLNRAEECFDKDRDIRGELDLMLAQAELQHAKEVHKQGQWRYREWLLSHGFALGLAMLVAIAGIGGSYLLSAQWQSVAPAPVAVVREQHMTPSPEPVAVLELTAAPTVPPARDGATALAPVVVSTRSTSPTASDRQEIKYEQRRQTANKEEKALDMPPEEMQKLVRAAGKTLRGQ